jgi:hypothetical protein
MGNCKLRGRTARAYLCAEVHVSSRAGLAKKIMRELATNCAFFLFFCVFLFEFFFKESVRKQRSRSTIIEYQILL